MNLDNLEMKMKTVLLLAMGLAGAVWAQATEYPASAEGVTDWRQQGTPQEQLAALVDITPGTSHWMPEIAYRYQSLYWAGKQGQWQFANYQIHSMEKMLTRVGQARVKRRASLEQFKERALPRLFQAVKSKNWSVFEQAVMATGAECMACHVREGYGFITVPAVPSRPNSIVLGEHS